MFEEYSDNFQDIELFPNGKIFRISYDCTIHKFKLFAARYDDFDEIRNAFSVDNPTAFFVHQYGYRAENKLYAINKFGYFSCGLIWEVFQQIKTTYGSLSVIALSKNCLQYINDKLTPLKEFVKKINDGNIKISNISDDVGRNNELIREGKKPFEFRDYQANSISKLLNVGYGRGLIEIPTAGGKSFILSNFCWNLHKSYNRNLKYLILVPNKQLVSQMHDDFIDYGYDRKDITKFTAGLKKNEAFNKDAKIIVANRQYVFKHKNELPKIDVLICDEVHTCLSDQTYDFIESLNAPIKIGCSGTLPRDKFNKWKILGLFSKIVYQEDILDLQKRGYISKLKITLLKITDKVVEADTNLLFNLHTTRKYRPDENGYSEIAFDDANNAEHEYFSKHYKDLYEPVFEYVKSLNSNTLILFDRIEIGTNLYQYAKELYDNKNVYYIDGSVDVKVREQIRSSFEASDGNLLFAQTSTFSTGINIKRLTNLIFLTGSKSFSQVLQSIGRTLRLHDSKTEAHLIDISWNFKYSQKHLSERLKIYKTAYNKKPDEIIKYEIK